MSLAKIGNKIFRKEVELSKEQINLTAFGEMKALESKVQAAQKSAYKASFDVSDTISSSVSALEGLIKIAEKARKGAQELGADDYVKRADAVIKEYKDKLNSNKKALSSSKAVSNLIR